MKETCKRFDIAILSQQSQTVSFKHSNRSTHPIIDAWCSHGHHIYTLGLPTLRWVHPGQSMSSCRSLEPKEFPKIVHRSDRARCAKALTLACPTESGIFKRWLMKVAIFPFETNGNRTNEWISLQYIYFTRRRSFYKKSNNTIHSLSGMVYLLMRFTVPCDRCGSLQSSGYKTSAWYLEGRMWTCCNLRCSSPIPSISIHV